MTTLKNTSSNSNPVITVDNNASTLSNTALPCIKNHAEIIQEASGCKRRYNDEDERIEQVISVEQKKNVEQIKSPGHNNVNINKEMNEEVMQSRQFIGFQFGGKFVELEVIRKPDDRAKVEHEYLLQTLQQLNSQKNKSSLVTGPLG